MSVLHLHQKVEQGHLFSSSGGLPNTGGGNVFKTQGPGPLTQGSDSLGLEDGPRICISNKLTRCF